MRLLFVCAVLCLFAASVSAIEYPPTLVLQATIRDFWACNSAHNDTPCGSQSEDLTHCPPDVCHPDFERYTVDDRGIPMAFLDKEGKPVLNTTSEHPSITNSESYSSFFRNVPGKNIPFVKNITLLQCPDCGVGFYKYENTSFFALDNQGWGNYYNNKNYHFTAEIETTFVYTGGEVFHFLGDDDLWVFIDGKLVLDLGGPHLAERGSVSIDDLGLQLYTTHTMKIFYCERYTFLSELTIVTTIQFLCDQVDRCGVCHGDGQSCCTCDDQDSCTYQKCDPLRKDQVCIFSPVCEDNNACTVNSCKDAECTFSANTCDDKNECTLDYCNNSTGCSHTTINCDDQNPCTTDSCSIEKGCTHISIDCEDGDPCTIDTCNSEGGCTHTATNGKCVKPYPSCGKNTCCDDSNPCTIDTCDAINGCRHIAVESGSSCNDGQICNGKDTCDAFGRCSNHSGTPDCTIDDQICTQICLNLESFILEE